MSLNGCGVGFGGFVFGIVSSLINHYITDKVELEG